MDRRVAWTLLVGALMALLLVAISTSGQVPLAERGPSMPFDLPEFDLSQATPTTLAPEPGDAPNGGRSTRSDNVISFLTDVLLLGLIGLIGLGLVKAWQHRPTLIWRPTAPTPANEFELLEEIASSVTAEAAAQRAALRHGEARNAIVACWSHLEHLVIRVGFERDPADTAAEFTARVLNRYPVDPVAIDRLSTLYREARFSSHAIGETHRAGALDALDAIHIGLRRASKERARA